MLPSVRPAHSWLAVANMTVKLMSPGGGGGSGFPIGVDRLSDGTQLVYILTAAHVVNRGIEGWSATIAKERYLGTPRIVKIHPTLDAAIVRVIVTDGLPVFPVPLRKAQAQVGERVWAIGYPAVGRRTITDGYIGEPNCASTDIFPGNSGGPVCDEHGRVIGIVVKIGVAQGRFGEQIFIQHDMIFVPVAGLIDWAVPWTE